MTITIGAAGWRWGGVTIALMTCLAACTNAGSMGTAIRPVRPRPAARTYREPPTSFPDSLVGTQPQAGPKQRPLTTGWCSGDGWCWDNPLPQGQDLHAVWGRSGSDVLAVGAQGTVLHFDGHRWRRRRVSIPEDLVGVQGHDETRTYVISSQGGLWRLDGQRARLERREASALRSMWGDGDQLFAVGDRGSVLRFDGTTWQRDEVPTEQDLVAVSGSSRYRVFAVGRRGAIVRFNGWSWHGVRPPVTAHFDRVWVGPTLLIVSTADRAFIHDGRRWKRTPLEPIHGCWRKAHYMRCLSGRETWLLHHGKWSRHPAPRLARQVRSIWSPDGRQAFAVGDAGLIHHFARHRWTEQSYGDRSDLYAIWGSGPRDIWAVGQSAIVLHSDGTHWQVAADLASGLAFNDVWGSSAQDVYAVGNGGLMAHFDGRQWTQLPRATHRHLHAVWGSSSNDVYVGGEGGVLLHFDGARWQQLRINQRDEPAPSIVSIGGHSADNLWVLGRVDRSWHWNGRGWTALASRPLNDAWVGAQDRLLTAGRGLWWYHDQNWRVLPAPREPINALWSLDGSEIYAVGARGAILHRDGAGRWRAHQSGTTTSLTGLWGHSYADVFAVGLGGTVLRRRSGPNSRTAFGRGSGAPAR